MPDNLAFSMRNVLKKKSAKRVIIHSPDVVAARVHAKIWTCKGTFEPKMKTLMLDNKVHIVAPFLPVAFSKVQLKTHWPARVIGVCHCKKKVSLPRLGATMIGRRLSNLRN